MTVATHTDRADPPRSRGNDVRLVRLPHRAEPERAGRRRGDGQPRHRPGGSALRSERRVGRRPRRHRRGRGIRSVARVASSRRRATSRRALRAAARRRGRVERARRAARDGDAAAVRRLGVGRVRALDAGRPLGGLAVPSRRLPGGAPPRGDDGHADLDRDARRLGLVDGRAARRARRRHVLRGCRRDHDVDPARALPRVARPASLG